MAGKTAHRRALTKLLLSDHCLALERLRWLRPKPPRHLCLSRLCMTGVESSEHTFFECSAQPDQLLNWQEAFMRCLRAEFFLATVTASSSVWKVRTCITFPDWLDVFAHFAYDLWSYYESVLICKPDAVSDADFQFELDSSSSDDSGSNADSATGF